MQVNDPLYKKQGIHLLSSIFTVEKGVTKILLVQRSNEPFKGKWALVGGALHNDEDMLEGLKREVYEKSGIKDINYYLCDVHGKLNRSPVMRMVAISYLGIIDNTRVNILKETFKTSNADWVSINNIPDLAYDHNEIIKQAIEKLKEIIQNTTILKTLFPDGFTIPEIQKAYESILNKKFDRRNFRRKLLNTNLIYDTKKEVKFDGKKPAKVYQFIENVEINKNVF